MAFFGLLLTALGLQAQPQFFPTGEVIPNIASVSFTVGDGTEVTLNSNEVEVLISRFDEPAFSLTQDASYLVRPGATITLPHTLVNQGLIKDEYTIAFTNGATSGSDYQLQDLVLIQDLNGNGIADPDEPEISSGEVITIPGGETVEFIFVGVVPSTVNEGNLNEVVITATSTNLGTTQINTDDLLVRRPVLSLTKTVTSADAAPLGSISYRMTGSNTGAPAEPFSVSIDGAVLSRVILRDKIPANTEFAAFGSSGSAQPLYHLIGNDTHVYQTAAPLDLSTVSAVAWAMELNTGDSFDVAFTASVRANAFGSIVNTAQLLTANEDLTSSVTNDVESGQGPEFVFFDDDTFEDTTNNFTIGDPINAEIDAAACNQDAEVEEIVSVIVESALTGDVETFIAVETAPNSGVFRITNAPTGDANILELELNNGTLEVLARDTLTATVEGCGTSSTSADVIIDPAGVVFNPLTCEPIPNVTVTLIDVTGEGNGGRPGEPAIVLAADGLTPSPNPYFTLEDGFYEFPLVAPSIYRIEVDAGETAIFPSPIPATACIGDRLVRTGSDGEEFPVDVSTGAVFIDISVFIPFEGGFGLQKTASRETAEPGDSVLYEIKANLDSNYALTDAVIDDVLPRGFSYIPDTARLDGVEIGNPDGGRGPNLRFGIGRVEVGQEVVLTYGARVEQGTPTGNAINTAVIRNLGSVDVESEPATALVNIVDGAFTDRGIVVGKVYVDSNRNRVQDAGEPGVPGIRLYMEDGTFVISDSEGAYSFYGVTPKTHVLKLDRNSLPEGARVLELDSRNAGDGSSRFVDTKRGEIHKADFIIAGDPEVLATVLRWREAAAERPGEIERALRQDLDKDYRQPLITDGRSLPASGTVSGGSAAPSDETSGSRTVFTSLLPSDTITSENSALPEAPVRENARLPLEAWVERATDNSTDFLGLEEGSTIPSRQIDVRVKGPLGAKFITRVNGEPIADDRVATRVVSVHQQVEAWEYLGIPMMAGQNRLELSVIDPFGNERPGPSINILAPDQFAEIRVHLPNPEPAADGRTPVNVEVSLIDEKGTPVTSRTPLTLEATHGEWMGEDLDPVEPGVQVFIENGRGTYRLLPPIEPGDGTIVISSGAISTEQMIPFLPELRPMVASGIVEGSIIFKSGGSLSLGPVSAADAFTEELSELSDSDDLRSEGRAAFFLKGKVKGNLLLTAAYDSDKDTRERLFRDIEPDRYYPVYGDSSVRGYDAQSTRKLYLRVDHKRSYLLVGDFQTRFDGEQRGLGNYTRSLNGVKGHYETNRIAANVWASEDTTRRVVDEQPANGTSGPYQFQAASGLVNSEIVEILTRDRDQLSIILDVEPQERFVDYDYEPFSGRIMFRRPVRAFDSNLNPRYIRITYEVDQGGDPFWVYGADAQARVTDRLEVGGSVVQDENPEDNQELYSANATLRLGPSTFVLGELAATSTDLKGSGMAGRIDLRHQDEKTDVRVFYAQTESSFENPGSLLTPGRIEAAAKVTRSLDEKNRIIGQVLETEDTRDAGGSLRGVRVDWQHSFDNRVILEVGARTSREEGTATGITTRPGGVAGAPGGLPGDPSADLDPFEVNSLRIKVTAPVPNITDARIFGEYEQDILKTDQLLAAVGGDWQISNKTKLYLRHEFISSLGGSFELNTLQQNNVTLFGVETAFLRDTRFFNEYRARNAFDGREAEASTGLRNEFAIAAGLRLQASVERITPFDGTTQNESTAIATGLEYTDNPDWKGTARLEARYSNQSDTYLNSLGYARKINRDWTLLAKSIYYEVIDQTSAGVDSVQARLLTGFAWRQTQTNKWNALGRYEYRYEDGVPFDSTVDVNRNVHIVSLSVNYQPDSEWIFSGRYAAKLVDERLAYINSTYTGHQASMRVTRDIGKRWDAGLSASLGWSHGFDRRDWALGPEIGYNFATNLRVGVGYNVVGFYDRDLAGDVPTQQGVFLNMRMKFDEGFGPLRALTDEDDPARRREDTEVNR